MQTWLSGNIDFVAATREKDKSQQQKEMPIHPVNFETTQWKISSLWSDISSILSQQKTLTIQETRIRKSIENDKMALNTKFETAKQEISEEFRGKIEQLSQAMNISRTEVTQENLWHMKKTLKNFIKNNEGIEKNLDLEIGDKMLWNPKNQSLVVSGVNGKVKFSIRFAPETPEETKQSENIAKEEQSREDIEKQGEKLGNWIVRRGAYPWKKNSCGASCGELLNQFGFRKILPQSGRDGKNWDTIIERYASAYFEKIPVNHPDDAPAGSILVFNENARLGTSTRREYGHVEIKGSNGMYYSYYQSINPAGSSKTSEKNPERYKKLTGFTGYAYVYNGKLPPK